MKLTLCSLAKSPGFTAVAILTLALGIGANTAIFSLIKSVLLRPLPYPHPEQIVTVWEKLPALETAPTSWISLQDFQRENRSFTALAGYRVANYTLSGSGEPENLNAAGVSASFFSVLGIAPQLGRFFTADEDKPGTPNLVLLTDGLWRRRFSGDPSILGRTLTLNNDAFTVIGVLPADFSTPTNVEFITQLSRGFWDGWNQRGFRHISILGRLKPGLTLSQALADLQTIVTRVEQNEAGGGAGTIMNGQLLSEQMAGGYRSGLLLLLGAVALVLLIACANLANLLLARSAARESEIAVRAALGASRAQIVHQLLAECLLLALAGGALGIFVALWVCHGIAALSPVVQFQNVSLDASVLAAAAALSLLTVLVFGVWPAWQVSRTDVRLALQSGGRTGSSGRASTRARETLIVAEVALTLVLLVGAGLLLKSLARARELDLGFDPQGVLTAKVSLPWRGYDTQEKRQNFQDRLLARLAALPGVSSAAISSVPPLTPANRSWQESYLVDGEPTPPPSQEPMAEFNAISADYFRTLGIPLLRGRTFSLQDRRGSTRVAIIDQNFAVRHWPNGDALGPRIRLGPADTEGMMIIGIVPTLRLQGYAAEPRLPQAYVAMQQDAGSNFVLLIRSGSAGALSRDASMGLASAVRAAMREIDPAQAIHEIRTFDQIISSTLGAPRLYTLLLSVFAGVALLLASLGLYGVLAYHVTRRQREFGIRIALGALNSQLLALVLRRSFRLIGTGVALGLIGALAISRVMDAVLYQTSAFDPLVFAAVTALLCTIALLASWLPARRAMRVQPTIALRAE